MKPAREPWCAACDHARDEFHGGLLWNLAARRKLIRLAEALGMAPGSDPIAFIAGLPILEEWQRPLTLIAEPEPQDLDAAERDHLQTPPFCFGAPLGHADAYPDTEVTEAFERLEAFFAQVRGRA